MLEHSQTAKEMLDQWDAGENVFTVEMGGLGPGYEQAIQILVMEIIRDKIDKPVPLIEIARSWGDDIASRIDKNCGGFSGAQVGAARQLAYRLMKDGPSKCFETLKEQGKGDRLIQISKFWPCAERTAPEPLEALRRIKGKIKGVLGEWEAVNEYYALVRPLKDILNEVETAIRKAEGQE